jgi:tRNA A-37 threonylcarbamoyl transferase component Bud32
LVYIKLRKDDTEFSKKIKEVFGIYKLVRNIRSKKTYNKEKAETRLKKEREYAEEFSKQIADLDRMGLNPEEWRKRRDEWQKEHPNPS